MKILLIEDDPAHAELVRRGLEAYHMANEIYHVVDGKAALSYLFRRGVYADARRSPRPHVILLDLRLPKISGLEVLRQIKTADELRHIPVVVLSTSSAEHDIRRAYDRHANGYVVKPVQFDEFQRLLEEMGHFWLRWNQAPSSEP